MRKKLLDIIKNSIVIKYKLPFNFQNSKNLNISSGKSNLTSGSKDEYCFEGADSDVSKVIYNGIIEFAENEFNIDYKNLDKEQVKAIKIKLRYDETDSSETKLQYGFYGEVLLDLFLRSYFQTDVLIARGYFYSPLENAEAKGFDAFHLLDNKGKLELWFGEAKFHKSFSSGIHSVITKMNNSLSDNYLNTHLFAIIKEKKNISKSHLTLNRIIENWENDPEINLIDELKSNNVELVYPIFIAYQKQPTYCYEESITSCVKKINDELRKTPFSPPVSINVSVFVMLLPVEDSNKLKKEVIEWIERKEPLI